MLLYWHPNQVIYNSYILYWTALPVMLLLPVIPTTVFFLSIDRWLILLFPTNYVKYKMIYFARGALAASVFVMIVVIVIQVAPVLPLKSSTSCRSIECFFVDAGLIPDFYVHFRWVLSILNMALGIVFLMAMKKRNKKNQSVFQTNRRVVSLSCS